MSERFLPKHDDGREGRRYIHPQLRNKVRLPRSRPDGGKLHQAATQGLTAMVKRQEEVQSAIMLPQMLIICGYVLFFFMVFTPDATLTKVLPCIPFWTPMLMLARLAVGTVARWEIVVTIALMLVAIVACTWFAARLYRYGVLMYRQRSGLGQLLELARMN